MISKATPVIAGLALVAGDAIGWFADAKWGRAAAHSGDGPGAANTTVAPAEPAGGRLEAASSSTTQPVANASETARTSVISSGTGTKSAPSLNFSFA